MLFNSLDFALFLPVVFALYWFVARNNLRWQNVLLLVASYFFYACWDYRFLSLLAFSTLLDYYTALRMQQASSQRIKKIWLWTTLLINVGILGVFKYYNFFTASFAVALSGVGIHADFFTLSIILPLGISFYTFHGLSYVIDVYTNRIKPVRNLIDYALFVSFFPLLVAGPIERATHLLPQLRVPRQFNYANAVDGLRQILWGLFKKIVIADNCAEFADIIFGNYSLYGGSTLLLGALFFAFQIYGDFSGYSDIAIGTARLFGIELLRNFAFPYFSRDIAEFWRRWHISLTSWFRDYLYIPLGGSKGGTWLKIRNTLIIFLVSGFWHGANWTFITWGLLNAIFFIPLVLTNKHRKHLEIVAAGKTLPTWKELVQMIITFGLVVFAWIFFRSPGIGDAFEYAGSIFTKSIIDLPEVRPWKVMLLVLAFVVIEWAGREQSYALAKMGLRWNRPLRWGFYYLLITAIFLYAEQEKEFIYFQF